MDMPWDDDDAVEEFTAALAKVRSRRSAAAPVSRPTDYSRFVANMKVRAAIAKPAKLAPTEHAPNRESCTRCGIPGSKGCDHWLPCDAAPVVPKLVTSTAAEPEAHSGAIFKRLSPEELAFVAARRNLTRKEIHAAFVAQFPDRQISVTSINYILARAVESEL